MIPSSPAHDALLLPVHGLMTVTRCRLGAGACGPPKTDAGEPRGPVWLASR